MSLRQSLNRLAERIQQKQQWRKYYPLYEMVDTFIYWTNKVTQRAPHIRDGLDIKRVMSYVVLATLPCTLMAWYNTGYQAYSALPAEGLLTANNWQELITLYLGIPMDANNIWACLWLGFIYFLPIYMVTLIVGGAWEILFAIIRGHEINEGFFVTSILYTLCLPPSIPLWLVALGISFGVVIGKEIFGGTGKKLPQPCFGRPRFSILCLPQLYVRQCSVGKR